MIQINLQFGACTMICESMVYLEVSSLFVRGLSSASRIVVILPIPFVLVTMINNVMDRGYTSSLLNEILYDSNLRGVSSIIPLPLTICISVSMGLPLVTSLMNFPYSRKQVHVEGCFWNIGKTCGIAK